MRFAGSVVLVSALFLPAACSGLGKPPPGTIEVAWDPVPDEDLAGYRVHFGETSLEDCRDPDECEYDDVVDVGLPLPTVFELVNLRNCTTWFVAVTAYDESGQSSPEYSNEVSGWPRPLISAVTPSSGAPGESLTVRIQGTNFADGTRPSFPGSKIVIDADSVDVKSCYEMTGEITISADASEGWATLEVRRPSGVFGRAAELFRIVPRSTLSKE